MSDARVTFARLSELYDPPSGQEQTFAFNCPKKNGRRCEGLIISQRTNLPHDPQSKNGGIAQWEWPNAPDRSTPTFTPSINCGRCGWHGYIEKGRCVNTAKQDEPEPPPQ